MRKVSALKIRLAFYLIILVSSSFFLINGKYRTFKIPLVDQVREKYCIYNLPKTSPFTSEEKTENKISKEEKNDFFQKLDSLVTDEKSNDYKKFFRTILNTSPEGFNVINTFAKRQPEEFKLAIENWTPKLNNETAAVIVHEFTHSAQYPCFVSKYPCKRSADFETATYNNWDNILGFEYDDESISTEGSYWINNNTYTTGYESDSLYSFDQISEKLPASTPLDTRDNEDRAYAKQDLVFILGEINAYTKSSRLIRALNCSQITKRNDKYFHSQNLARQLVHLYYYIQFAKEKRPQTYEYLIQNKALALITLRLEQLAREEIGIVLKNASPKDKINSETSPEGIRFNMEILAKKHPYMDTFYEKANVSRFMNVKPAKKDLESLNIKEINID